MVMKCACENASLALSISGYKDTRVTIILIYRSISILRDWNEFVYVKIKVSLEFIRLYCQAFIGQVMKWMAKSCPDRKDKNFLSGQY